MSVMRGRDVLHHHSRLEFHPMHPMQCRNVFDNPGSTLALKLQRLSARENIGQGRERELQRVFQRDLRHDTVQHLHVLRAGHVFWSAGQHLHHMRYGIFLAGQRICLRGVPERKIQ